MQVERARAGVDAGKEHHHVVVVDFEGRKLLSRRVANDEAALREIVQEALTRADEVTWAIDLADGPAALMITLLLLQGQHVHFPPGVAVNRAASAYRGEGKTDAKDAAVITDQVRMRRDLRELRLVEEEITELRMLTAHRADLAADRTRTINRLRIQLVAIFPVLERVLDFTNRGPLILVTEFQTPAALTSIEEDDLERWLRERKVRHAAKLASTARRAAQAQPTKLPGETMAANLVRRLAATILRPNEELKKIDSLISARFHSQPSAEIITTMVGIGDLLGAEFLAAIGGGLDGFASADHLAGYAGLAPTPHVSGKRTGNLRRPQRYNRQLQRVFYTSAMISIQHSPASRAFYNGKRAQGKRHTQAVLALARRRVNVLWAMLRDHHPYEEHRPLRVLAA